MSSPKGAFARELATIDLTSLSLYAETATDADVTAALAADKVDLRHLAALLSPAAERRLEEVASAAQQVTRQRFGKAVRLFAPLYVSNACLSSCTY